MYWKYHMKQWHCNEHCTGWCDECLIPDGRRWRGGRLQSGSWAGPAPCPVQTPRTTHLTYNHNVSGVQSANIPPPPTSPRANEILINYLDVKKNRIVVLRVKIRAVQISRIRISKRNFESRSILINSSLIFLSIQIQYVWDIFANLTLPSTGNFPDP